MNPWPPRPPRWSEDSSDKPEVPEHLVERADREQAESVRNRAVTTRMNTLMERMKTRGTVEPPATEASPPAGGSPGTRQPAAGRQDPPATGGGSGVHPPG
jgi:hypothetical protein